ncbi:hypothetical protein Tco_1092509 [Tanacetum coccineum]|uniref:Transposase (Putative), gypsy type n=1 Tax=Tanacetum coccineum TaxID=301880 RepID=A0ABQ5IA28_9ASTR
MGKDTLQLEGAVSTISEEYLLEFTSKYGISESLHPELPGPEEPIVEFTKGKVGVYTKFFEFANYLIPISQFLFDILGFYEIHLSQLSVIGAAKQATGEEHSTVLYKASGLLEELEQSILLDMDLFNLISALNSAKVKTRTRPRAAHEVPILTVTASLVIEMEDMAVALGSSGTPSALEKSPLDFVNEDPPQMITEMGGTADQVQDGFLHEIPPVETTTTTEVIQEPGLEKDVAAMRPLVNKRRHKRGNDEAEAKAPPKVLRKDHAAFRPAHSTLGGKSLASMGLEVGSTFFTPAMQETPYGCEECERSGTVVLCETTTASRARHCPKDGPRDPYRKCCYRGGARSALHGKSGVREIDLCPIYGRVARKYLPAGVGRDQQLPPGYPGRMPRHAWQVAMGSQPRLRFEQEVRLQKKATSKISRRDQRIQPREREIKRLDQEIKSLRTMEAEVHGLRNRTKNLETLLESEVDMKKATEAKIAGQAKELESLCEKIKAIFKEFKKYGDDRVEQRCAEMDARLDKLSVDFDEELYPHMLTAIAGRRWVIGHGLRLAVMKCAESP